MKAVNATSSTRATEIRLNGLNPSSTATVTTLGSPDLNAENSLDHPRAVAPRSSTLAVKSANFAVQLEPYSVTVYRIPVQ